jgi:hypothetical protein
MTKQGAQPGHDDFLNAADIKTLVGLFLAYRLERSD